jgi:hypothetical protein
MRVPHCTALAHHTELAHHTVLAHRSLARRARSSLTAHTPLCTPHRARSTLTRSHARWSNVWMELCGDWHKHMFVPQDSMALAVRRLAQTPVCATRLNGSGSGADSVSRQTLSSLFTNLCTFVKNFRKSEAAASLVCTANKLCGVGACELSFGQQVCLQTANKLSSIDCFSGS